MTRLLGLLLALPLLVACSQPIPDTSNAPPPTLPTLDTVLDGVVQTADRVDRVCSVVEGAPLTIPDEVELICLLARGFASPGVAPTDALAACARAEPLVREDEFAHMYDQVCAPLLTHRAETALRAATVAVKYFESLGDPRYTPPQVVLFEAGTETPCGTGQGSRYCPVDERVYLDTRQLAKFDNRTGRSDFLAGTAFTVWHEFAHDYQHDTGQLAGYGLHAEVTFRVENSADCYTGAVARLFEASGDQLAAGQIVAASIGGAVRGSHGTGGLDGERVAGAMRGYTGGDCHVDAVPV